MELANSAGVSVRTANSRNLTLVGLAALAVLLVGVVTNAVIAESNDSAPTEPIAQAVEPQLAAPVVLTPSSDGRNGAPLALVNGNPMFPLPGSGEISGWIGNPVEAHGLTVVGVEELGFWLGLPDRDEQRIYVRAPDEPSAGPALAFDELEVGQLVNVSGRVAPLPENLGALGLSAQDRESLANASALLDANSVRPPTFAQ
jgi:hypothetical protein